MWKIKQQRKLAEKELKQYEKRIKQGTIVGVVLFAVIAFIVLGYREVFFASAEQAPGYVSSLNQFTKSRRLSAEETADIFLDCTLHLHTYCESYKVAFGYQHPTRGIKTFSYPGVIVGTEDEVKNLTPIVYFNPANPSEAAIRNLSTEFAEPIFFLLLALAAYLIGQTMQKNLREKNDKPRFEKEDDKPKSVTPDSSPIKL